MPAKRHSRQSVALTALRPFVRLSQRLERQVAAAPPVAPPPQAAPAAATEPQAAPAVATGPAGVPPSAPEPRQDPSAVAAQNTSELASDPFEAVDASVVPVPIESLNRLVIAVDELGSEMTNVRQAIRELTTTLSESQSSLARILSARFEPIAPAAQVPPAAPPAPDPFDAVTGPYVSGHPAEVPFDPAATDAAWPSPPDDRFEIPTGPQDPFRPTAPADAMLDDLPIVSSGGVQVAIGPIASLDELDDAITHIGVIPGVEQVTVSAFEDDRVVLAAELSRPLPLASLLRSGLGRDVASCRQADGRIVVDFEEHEPSA